MKENERFILEKIEKVVCPEDKENFKGQKVLVICGPDAHGVCSGVASALYLEKRGAQVEIFSNFPETHPGTFWEKTIDQLNLEGFDRVVISDLPLDARTQEKLKKCEEKLLDLSFKIDEERKKRNLPQQEVNIFYLDHHSTSTFTDQVLQTEEMAPKVTTLPELAGIKLKITQTAEACRLGKEESKIARLGAICDRDPNVLPVLEEERLIAYGLDIAVKGDPEEARPAFGIPEYEEYKKKIQKRINVAIWQLKKENWDYFKELGEKMSKIEVPVACGFGQVIIIESSALKPSFVLKGMEIAVQNMNIPYGLAIHRQLPDPKMGREEADVITIIRDWRRKDLPSVCEILEREFGKENMKKMNWYGGDNAKTVRLKPNNIETARLSARLIEAFAGKEMPDYSRIKKIVICGDPNSGKSVFSTILRQSLETLGVKVAHLDLDKAAPTPSWFLEAETKFKFAKIAYEKKEISEEEFKKAEKDLEEAKEKRKTLKRPWTMELAEEAKNELEQTGKMEKYDIVIGDIGGGRPIKDKEGKIVKIQRLSEVNAKILEAVDGVFIISNSKEGAEEWKKLIENRRDPETGVEIKREKPIKILGIYRSVLEGVKQKIMEEEPGLITNLDRSNIERKYNPVIFTTAVFISRSKKEIKNK